MAHLFHTLRVLIVSFLIIACRCQEYYSMHRVLSHAAPASASYASLGQHAYHEAGMHSAHLPLYFMSHGMSRGSHNPGSILLNEESTRIKAITTIESDGSMGVAKVPEKTGDVSYISPEGASVKLNYVADENGYQVDSSFSNDPQTAAGANRIRTAHEHSGRTFVHHSAPTPSTLAHMHSNVRTRSGTHQQAMAHHSEAVAALLARMGMAAPATSHGQHHHFQHTHLMSHHAPAHFNSARHFNLISTHMIQGPSEYSTY